MAYTVLDAISELNGMLHGTNTNQITGLYGVFNRAARQLLLDIDPQETIRITQTEQIFNQVYPYSPPEDLKGNRIVDIRPQTDRMLRDNPNNTYSRNFSLGKMRSLSPQIHVEFDSASKSLMINNPILPYPVQVANTDQIVGNGTWSLSGSASNLQQDLVDYVNGYSSLSFDLAVLGTQAAVVNSTLATTNLTNHLYQSHLFLTLEMPTASVFTSVELRWGSDASNYWTKTETHPFNVSAFQDGWNTIGFDWSKATQVGSPNVQAVDYVEVLINYDGTAQTGVKFSGVSSNLGSIYQIAYYSKYMFRTSAGTWMESLPDDATVANTYIINLDTESYNLFVYKLAEYCVQQALGQDALYDTQFFQQKYAESLARYKALYPSEAIKLREAYYRMPNQGYRRSWGVPYTR